jgi:hypothetical protein
MSATTTPSQPDFALIAKSYDQIQQGHYHLAVEVNKFQNIAAINTNNEILNTLQRIEARQIAFEARQIAFETRLIASYVPLSLTKRIILICYYSKQNSISRLQNSHLKDPDSLLHPMFSLRTNDLIPTFPPTPNSITSMSATALSAVLRELDLNTQGNVAVKRARLRAYIGLTAKSL